MLVRLEIDNFAVISHAVFEAQAGLNVISGETGAGKSILIDAISLILGAKASKSIIRTDAEDAFVEAVFDISGIKDPDLRSCLEESGIDTDDGLLIVSRKISKDGKSIARINGRTVILAVLKKISSYLVDIHGQHDTQKIFDSDDHTDMLDSFGGDDIRVLFEAYTEKLKEYKELVLEIRRLSQLSGTLQKRKEELEYAVNEISKAAFRDGEEEKLTARRKELLDIKRDAELFEQMNEFMNSEDSSGMSVVSRLDSVKSASNVLYKRNDAHKDLNERISQLYLDAQALSDDLRGLVDKAQYDPSEVETIEKRLGLLYDLKRKYGSGISEINDYSVTASEELDQLKNGSLKLAELKKERIPLEAELKKVSELLSEERHKKARILSEAICSELRDLEMPNARFDVDFKERSKDRYFSSKGTEDIRFMFSANPGEELRELAQTASGGEASRIMLAIKNILSEADKVQTLVFDEIDTGVSGKASLSIASKLRSISRAHQVLCVTHTAQLAAAADNNFFISKSVSDGRTSTKIDHLDEEGKISEISRLLSGTSSSESVDLAKKLIESLRT